MGMGLVGLLSFPGQHGPAWKPQGCLSINRGAERGEAPTWGRGGVRRGPPRLPLQAALWGAGPPLAPPCVADTWMMSAMTPLSGTSTLSQHCPPPLQESRGLEPRNLSQGGVMSCLRAQCWVRIQALPLLDCTTLDPLPNLSEVSFLLHISEHCLQGIQ